MSGSSAAAAYFTFHDVSINTYRYPMISTPVGTFTFHDVSINTTDSFIESLKLLALHSTMFLLIPQAETMLEQIRYTLHSTMFLLILLIAVCMLAGKYALHSTMFLLILDGNIIHDLNITFTFHDVSINTKIAQMPVNTVFSLHSTMFLLIPLPTPLFAFRIQLYIPRCFY